MEKARQMIQELQPEYEKVEDTNEDKYENLKIEVNNILHVYLPSNITVGQMESLAETIYHIVRFPGNFLTK